MGKRKVTNPESVLNVAVRLFERKGYQNTTVDDIAEAMKIAKPTIYKYVKSKVSLLEAAFDSLLGRLRTDMVHVKKVDRPDEQIETLIRVFLDVIHDLQIYFPIFFGEERELPLRTRRRIQAVAREITEEIGDLFAHAQRAGIVRQDVDPTIAAYLVSGMLASVARWYDPRGRLSREEIEKQIRRLLQGFYSSQATDVASARHRTTAKA